MNEYLKLSILIRDVIKKRIVGVICQSYLSRFLILKDNTIKRAGGPA
jgi:hypothetical protein